MLLGSLGLRVPVHMYEMPMVCGSARGGTLCTFWVRMILPLGGLQSQKTSGLLRRNFNGVPLKSMVS